MMKNVICLFILFLLFFSCKNDNLNFSPVVGCDDSIYTTRTKAYTDKEVNTYYAGTNCSLDYKEGVPSELYAYIQPCVNPIKPYEVFMLRYRSM